MPKQVHTLIPMLHLLAGQHKFVEFHIHDVSQQVKMD